MPASPMNGTSGMPGIRPNAASMHAEIFIARG